MDVHLVMDNYGTHKFDKFRGWLARHPRYQVDSTPTSGNWLNLVGLFAEVTERCVRPRQAYQYPDVGEDDAQRCSITWTGATVNPNR